MTNTTKSKKNTNEARKGSFAVIMTGGKQYKVQVGDTLKIEKMIGDYKEGQKVVFDKILLLDNNENTVVGSPFVTGSKVEALIEKIGRLPKVNVVHYKPKSKYFKKQGHKQPYFKVAITSIS